MAVEHRDPLLGAREPRPLRLWVGLAVVTTILAVATIVAAVLLVRQGPWSPVPVPSGVPS